MKTTYERWIEANHNLIKCFESVSQDQWNGYSAAEQNSLCEPERKVVQTFLVNNQVGFANLLKERLQIANASQH